MTLREAGLAILQFAVVGRMPCLLADRVGAIEIGIMCQFFLAIRNFMIETGALMAAPYPDSKIILLVVLEDAIQFECSLLRLISDLPPNKHSPIQK